jgi:hypothetical protein
MGISSSIFQNFCLKHLNVTVLCKLELNVHDIKKFDSFFDMVDM